MGDGDGVVMGVDREENAVKQGTRHEEGWKRCKVDP